MKIIAFICLIFLIFCESTVFAQTVSPVSFITISGETCACTQAITNPYHIVKTKKSKLDIVFQGDTVTLTCE